MTGETVVLGQKLVPLSQCHLSSATNPHMDLQSYGVLMGCLNYWLLSAISEQKKKRNCSHPRPFIKVGLASSAMFVVEIKSAGTAVTGGPHVMIRERKLQVSPALTFWVACCPQRYTGLFSRTLNSNYNPTYSKKIRGLTWQVTRRHIPEYHHPGSKIIIIISRSAKDLALSQPADALGCVRANIH